MKKQKAKYFYMAAFVLILVAFFLLYPKPSTTLIPDTITPSNGGILIPASYTDANVMPDKYSTGVPAGTTLTPISSAGTYNNVTYKISGGNKLGLDLFYNNTTVGDSIVISNVDFSAMPFIFLNEEQVTTPKTVTFVNCKFDSVTTGRQDCLITHYFERCTIRNFSGSNSILNNCIFGGSTTDGINPYRNVTITNSYICDLARSSSEIVHTDGVQIFGYAGLDAQNISFSNCRFEAPSFSYPGSASYVNACLMVALEKSNGNNISFRNCYVNGGGYTIYSTVTSGYKLSNIVFDDISVGCTARFGTFYNKNTYDGVTTNNVYNADSLYAGSIWKTADNNIHVSITNDTNQERSLLLVTADGEKTVTIPACPTFSQMSSSQTFSSLPFDLDITAGTGDWMVCFDTTNGINKQIRCINWSSENITLNEQELFAPEIEEETVLVTETLIEVEVENMPVLNNSAMSNGSSIESSSTEVTTEISTETSSSEETVVETEPPQTTFDGSCGSDISWTLDTTTGILRISGTGATYNYNSSSPAPWNTYKDSITSVVISDGVTKLGNQLFVSHSKIQSLELPASLETIGANSFINCKGLAKISIPVSIKEIQSFAFHGAGLTEVCYNGSEEEWNTIAIGSNNDPLINSTFIFQ